MANGANDPQPAGKRMRLTAGLALTATLILLSGCWTVSTQTIERDLAHWQQPKVTAMRAVVQQTSRVSKDGEDWRLDLQFYVGDLCAENAYREVAIIEASERVENKPAAAAPLIAGLVTLIATPFVVYYASTQTTDPLGNPIDPQPSELGAAAGIGMGIGGALSLGGLASIAVTRNGAGHHEKVVSSRKEDLGPLSDQVPCHWRTLQSGSGRLEAGGLMLPFVIVGGDAFVVLPSPRSGRETDFYYEWQVILDDLPSPDSVELMGSVYDSEIQRLTAIGLAREQEAADERRRALDERRRAAEERKRAEDATAQRLLEEELDEARRLHRMELPTEPHTAEGRLAALDCGAERLAEAYPQVRDQYDALLAGSPASATWSTRQEDTLEELGRCPDKVGRRATFYYAITQLVGGRPASAQEIVRLLAASPLSEGERRQIRELRPLIEEALEEEALKEESRRGTDARDSPDELSLAQGLDPVTIDLIVRDAPPRIEASLSGEISCSYELWVELTRTAPNGIVVSSDPTRVGCDIDPGDEPVCELGFVVPWAPGTGTISVTTFAQNHRDCPEGTTAPPRITRRFVW